MSTIICHAGLAAAGKSTAALAQAQSLGGIVLDIDEVNPIESRLAATINNDGDDRDSLEYYQRVYPVTLSLLGELICGALRVQLPVVVSASLLGEAREAFDTKQSLAELMEQTWGLEPETLSVTWHEVDPDVQHERMIQRGAPRDLAKLADWEAYCDRVGELVPKRSELTRIVDVMV